MMTDGLEPHHPTLFPILFPWPLTPFSRNSIKGRVAETIIQELFLAHDFNVFHYGMERSIPGIAQLTRKTFGAVKQQIRSMPDFVVQDPRNHKLHFVEVKYRASGSFSIEDIQGEYPWPQQAPFTSPLSGSHSRTRHRNR
jgi:hypothetical protein